MCLNVSLMKVHVIVIMISCATRITLIPVASVIGIKIESSGLAIYV